LVILGLEFVEDGRFSSGKTRGSTTWAQYLKNRKTNKGDAPAKG